MASGTAEGMSDIDKTSMRVVLDQFDRTFLLPLVADVKQVWGGKAALKLLEMHICHTISGVQTQAGARLVREQTETKRPRFASIGSLSSRLNATATYIS